MASAKMFQGRKPSRLERAQITLEDDYFITGEPDHTYNCFGWCLGVDGAIGPDEDVNQRADEYLIAAGYERLRTPPRTGDVIVLYTAPTSDTARAIGRGSYIYHVAKRAVPGWWESKLGGGYRVIHRLHDRKLERYYGPVDGYFVAALASGRKSARRG